MPLSISKINSMKQLSLNAGGHPLVIGDIDWLQGSYKQLFAELCRMWIKNIPSHSYADSDDVLILRGVKRVPSTYDVTEGYVYLDGEICFSPAWTRPTISNWDLWGLVKAPAIFDSSGDKVYANGTTNQTYSDIRAEWKLLADISPGTQYIPLETITEAGTFGLFDMIIPTLPIPQVVTLLNNSTGVIYAHRVNKIVTITGTLLDVALSGGVLATLPVTWNPKITTVYFNLPSQITSKYVTMRVNGLNIDFTATGFTNPTVDGVTIKFSVSYPDTTV